MNLELFNELAGQGFNRIPVTLTVLADRDTPVSTYNKLARGSYSYLFESVLGGEKWGRYSFIGLPSKRRLEVRGETIKVFDGETVIEEHSSSDPFEFVQDFHARYKVPDLDSMPRFIGGLVGYFGYDCIRYVEPKLKASQPEDVLGVPDIILMVSDELVVFDNLSGKLTFVVLADPSLPVAFELAQERLQALEEKLHTAGPDLPAMSVEPGDYGAESKAKSLFGKPAFLQAVDKIKDYTLAGDIMQAVVSQRLVLPYEAEPLNLYRALRVLNPSPYMYFMDLGDHQVVGSSPEILARVEHGELTVRPIAGTRRRGKTEEEDIAFEEELLADPKEIAEHLMLIDLGRNDVGRVAETGSVKLTEKMVIERFSHVMHITSNVVGQLKEGYSAIDAFKAVFPAGTLSGAPKIRAMEILDELEPIKRCVYGGAVGYWSWNGNMDTAIAIRTAVIKDGNMHVQSGGGVVADSIPALEWKESMNKARALFTALDMVMSKPH